MEDLAARSKLERSNRRVRTFYYCLCVAFLAFVIFITISVVVLRFTLFPIFKGRDITLPPEWKFLQESAASKRMNFAESQEYCRSINMSMLVLNNQDEENILFDWIKDQHSACDSFFLGFQASPSKRYKSLDGDITWPSLEQSFDAAVPRPHRTCVRILHNMRVTGEVPCAEVQSECFLCHFIKGGCSADPYSDFCFGIARDKKRNITAMEAVALCKDRYPTETSNYGLLIFDTTHIPGGRVATLQSYEDCHGYIGYALAAHYLLDYYVVAGSSPMGYQSKHLVVTEPNYDCLAVKKAGQIQLETESCKKSICTLCV